MKVLAFNGSPRGTHSNTDRILQPFLKGARDAGAETETIYLKDLNIRPCLGCFTCWMRTPGICTQKDDMSLLLEKMCHADIVVYATPLYVFTVSGLMKNFMDRTIPLADPHIIKQGKDYVHLPRYKDAARRSVLISNCGFPERDNFSALVDMFHHFMNNHDSNLVAIILRPMGELLRQPDLQSFLSWYFQAAYQAGQELIKLGHITRETQAILDRDFMPIETYVTMANAWWDSQIAVSNAEQEEIETGRPLPDPTSMPTTLQELIAGMPLAFNAQAAGDLQAVIQFDVSGNEPGEYYLHIANGKCSAFEGKHPNPNLIIHTPSDIWLAISRGEMDGMQAMMDGKYSIDGDLNLMIRFNELFSVAGTDIK